MADDDDLASRRSPSGATRPFSSIGGGEMELPKTGVTGGGLNTGDSNGSDSSSGKKYVSRSSYRRAAGASYVLAMGVCGIVLIALGSSLKDLALLVNRTSIEVCLCVAANSTDKRRTCCVLRERKSSFS